MQIVNLYTDGACSGNQNENNIGGWGAVLEFNGHEKELHGGELNTTNNRMELTAVISGLSALTKENLTIHIYSDSSYVINCFKNKWYVNWEKNGWKNSAKKPVENQELWMELLALVRKHTCSFYLVKGHVSPTAPENKIKPEMDKFIKHNGPVSYDEFLKLITYNNRCDALANVFIDENR